MLMQKAVNQSNSISMYIFDVVGFCLLFIKMDEVKCDCW